jgi:hypothetical protein
MTDSLAVPTVTQPEHLQLVALSPSDLAVAQADLIGWCDRKIVEVSRERRELKETLAAAKRNKWRHRPIATAVARVGRLVDYYSKLREALRAGYLIVPNFPVDIFAIRTVHFQPRTRQESRGWEASQQRATPLPLGAGRYVSQTALLDSRDREVKTDEGKNKIVTDYWARDFQDPQFPVAVVKPIILEAAQKAMALRLFDQLGVIEHSRKRDPILVGQILHPSSTRWTPRPVSFFIAWWLDTRSL